MRADIYRSLRDAITKEEPAALGTIIGGEPAGGQVLLTETGGVLSSLDDQTLADAIVPHLRSAIEDGGADSIDVEGRRVFIEAHLPSPHMIIVGAVHIAIPLVTIAEVMGYRTTVIDARGVFATDERFPHVEQLVEAWPDEALPEMNLHSEVAAVILAHDEKFEDPALEILLQSDVGYIGAIGSRKTSEARRMRLKGRGFTDEQLDRIHGPVGLDLGGRSPAEIALSIMAEIVAVKHGKDPKQATAPAKSA
ncbi:MAG: XdhC family protein [Chloroflexota bacterium]